MVWWMFKNYVSSAMNILNQDSHLSFGPTLSRRPGLNGFNGHASLYEAKNNGGFMGIMKFSWDKNGEEPPIV